MESTMLQTAVSAIEVEQLHVLLGGRAILEDLSLCIAEGEFITVLGPNGAGKSTLFKVLLGLLKPSAGTVRVLGQPPRRGNNQIGYAPQHRVLEADLALRARDVVGFGLDGNRWGPGWPSRRRTMLIDQALEEVDATHLANVPIGQLSGGEQQRLLIAQALLTHPRLLLLDEPLANLDISREREVVDLISKVCHQRNMTVMLVTHDVNPLLSVTDRVLYLANGHGALGMPHEVITGATLSGLYGSPVEVVQVLDRLFVVGAQT
jgi:zinc/manganese transport system ATP-binding protein